MNQHTIELLFLFIALTNFGWMLITMSIMLFLSYTRTDYILSHLEHSPIITSRTFFNNAGPWGRLLLIGTVAGLLASPDSSIRKGGASPEDIEKFPSNLKRLLVFLHRAGYVSIVILLILYAATALDFV